MGILERGFERELELHPDEAIRWRGPASHWVKRPVGGGAWVGGRVFVSDERFFFCPGALARGRCETVRLPRSAIAWLELLGRGRNWREGGLRPRLRLMTAGGDEYLFTMPRLKTRGAQIQALLEDHEA